MIEPAEGWEWVEASPPRSYDGAMTTARKTSPLILLTLPAAILLAFHARAELPPATTPVALVERVVDGDTVVVRVDGRSVKVRLIGVDAPESADPRKPVERFAHESAAFLRRLVEGKHVRLAYEPAGAKVDRYGRTLAYLYRVDDDLFVNRALVAKGYAFAYTAYPFAHMADFRAAERQAREQRLGLWGPAPAPSKPSADDVVYVTKTDTKYHRPGGGRRGTFLCLGGSEGDIPLP
jgi:micrococcal nuclease